MFLFQTYLLCVLCQIAKIAIENSCDCVWHMLVLLCLLYSIEYRWFFDILYSVCLQTKIKVIVLLNEWLEGNMMMFIFYNLHLRVCLLYINYLSCPEPLCLMLCYTSSVSKFPLIVKFHWDFTTTLKGCWQFYITLNTFLWYTVCIYFNLLVRHYFRMFMYDLSWKNVERFIGCLQFFVMDSLKICAIFQLTSWQSSI